MKKRKQANKNQVLKTFEGVLSVTQKGFGFVDLSKRTECLFPKSIWAALFTEIW